MVPRAAVSRARSHIAAKYSNTVTKCTILANTDIVPVLYPIGGIEEGEADPT
jgi:hypothetical protein